MRNVIVVLLSLAAPAAAVTEHKVSQTEHLWALAKRYYGDPFRWRAIAAANPQVKDPHWIYPGQVLVIPDLPEQAAAPAAAPIASAAPEPEAIPAPAAAPAPVVSLAAAPSVEQDGLSEEMPESLSGQYPSMTRLRAPQEWSHDGEVVEYEGREAMAAQGDFISGRFMKASASVGEKVYILRAEAPQDTDGDKKARYLVRVGQAQVMKDQGKGLYRLLIMQSGDSVQVGDFLSRKKL